jgi:hypothetical protein
MRSFLTLVFIVLVFAASSYADLPSREEVLDEYVVRPEEIKFKNDVDSYVRYMPSKTVDAQPGKVGLVVSEAEYAYIWKFFDRLPVRFALGTKYIGIDESVEVELPAHLTRLSTDIETTLPFFNIVDTYIRVGLSPQYVSDDWELHSSAFRIPVRAYFIYLPQERLTLLAGVYVAPDFANTVWPLVGFIYKATDRLTFNIVPSRPNIIYQWNKYLAFFGEADVNLNEFEVKYKDLKNTVLRYNECYLGAGIKLSPNKNIKISLSAGGSFNRRLQYKDSLGKVSPKDGYFTECRAEFAF